MKGIIPQSRWAFLRNNIASVSASDKICTEIDVGTAQNGTLAIVVNYTEAIKNLDIWTSSVSDFGSDTTAHAATTGVTEKVVISSDTSNLYACKYKSGANPSDLYGLSVSSNTIASIGESQMIVVNVKNLKRYLNVQYSGFGTSTVWSMSFIGHDLEEAPYAGARSAF